ncbi:MAG TPA: hypothetical protein VIM84_10230, partial [Gemmatimonadales bacterium]
MIRLTTSLLPLAALLSLLHPPSPLHAQTISVPAAALADSARRPAAIARLATEALAIYRDSNPLTQLDQRFRLQLLAGHPADARATLAEFRKAQVARGDTMSLDRALLTQYEIYLGAKQLQSDSGLAFAEGFGRAFRQRLGGLDDRTAGQVARALSAISPPAPETPWGPAGKSPRDTTVALADAVAWLRAVQIEQTYGEMSGPAAPLVREDDRRRYI